MSVPFPFRVVAPYRMKRHSNRVSPLSAYPSERCKNRALSLSPLMISSTNDRIVAAHIGSYTTSEIFVILSSGE